MVWWSEAGNFPPEGTSVVVLWKEGGAYEGVFRRGEQRQQPEVTIGVGFSRDVSKRWIGFVELESEQGRSVVALGEIEDMHWDDPDSGIDV